MNDSASPSLGTTRRDILIGGAGALLGAAAVGGGWAVVSSRTGDAQEPAEGEAEPPASPAPPAVRRFVSTQLTAVEVTAWRAEGAALSAGLLFTTPRSPVFRGVVYDNAGEPVWIEPDGNACTELRVQTYRGRPVLTYWTGQVLEGVGYGKGVILDERYLPVAEVRCGNGQIADLHEFQLTERGTALLLAYPVLPADLTDIGGPAEGWVYGAQVQEIDVATGEVLFDWDGLEHIGIAETIRERDVEGGEGESQARPFDPIHLNSVAEDGDALLLSARHTSALYRVDRRTGEILWRFGGKESDIEVPEGGEFGWQHDARRHADGTVTLYDNHEPAEETDAVSAALKFEIDEEARTAALVHALRYDDHYGYAMGNAQYLEDGHVVVGWGMDPVLTEFDESGVAVFELQGLGLGSYRSFRHPWRGRPATPPDLAIGPDGQAYVSWNGATEVARWRVLTGAKPGRLREEATVERTGFETAVPLASAPAYVLAEALDGEGRVLGRSRVLQV
ncbi:ArsR family transcriptional regulator [Nocardioides gansuensis]|uniref:ArsR family transcriptional regulator n=1 Tax=Nocardioides gansuensis TaxID=2138300 RepID=A0A2T8FGA9_9ACTN|nr:arylsulfotransferase family protein [Nocardioides gansuensis]PVG84727.1 ArsR family transcriptional regulator [Nocardioides gansuensis]